MDLKYSLEIIKILDKHLPAKGVGTEREVLRMKIHRDFTDLVNELLIQRVVVPKGTFYCYLETDQKCKEQCSYCLHIEG